MQKAKILIVEDEAIIAMEVESQLQILGYEVTSIVDTGEKALEKADADRPDLILMDIRIKGKMDGIDAAEAIRNRFGIPVIFSTAYLDQERIERAKITMPFGYVLKPIQDRDLSVTIEMALYVAGVDSKRKKAEDELERIFNLNPDPICTAGVDGYLKNLNPAWEKILGYTKEELVSKPLLEFIHPDDRQATIDEIERQVGGQPTITFKNRYRCKDGSYKLFDWKATASVDGMLYATARDITEQEKLAEILKESEEKYRCIVEDTPGLVCQFLPEGKITFVNDAYCSYFNKTSDDLVGKTILSSIPEEDRQTVNSSISSLDVDNPTHTIEHKVILKDGIIVWQKWTNRAIFDAQNRLKFYQSVGEDITEQKQTQETLKESEERYRTVCENTQIWIWETDANGLYTYGSSTVEKILGYRIKELIGKKHFYDLFHSEEKEQLKKAAFEIFAKKQSFKEFINRNVDKDGNDVWLSTSGVPLLDERGKLLGYRGADTKITYRI